MPNWNEIIEKLDYAFQPIVYSHTGKIYAVEALIRGVQKVNGLTCIDDPYNIARRFLQLYCCQVRPTGKSRAAYRWQADGL